MRVHVRRLLTIPYLVLSVAVTAGTVVAGLAGSREGLAGDVNAFALTGSRMLSGDWMHTFHDSTIQAGPLELALTSIASDVGAGQAGFAVVLDLGCMAAIVAAAAWCVRGRMSGLLAFSAGAFALSLPGEAYAGHPAELLIPVLWMLAAHRARRGRLIDAGVLVGVSGCLELWGVLGIAVLGMAPSLRHAGRSIGLAILVPIASLLPFVLGGDFHMLDYRWLTDTGPFGYMDRGGSFTWYDRVAEGAIVVGVGLVVARGTQRLRESVWIVPAAIALLRIALDPVRNDYYWDAPLVLLLIGAATLMAGRAELRARLSRNFASSTPTVLKP
jgi:hypothetical protein